MQAELVAADGIRGLLHQLAHDLAAGNRRRPDVRLVEPQADGVERVNIDPLRETRLTAQQPLQLGLQRIRQRVGEGRQQDAGVGMRARQMGGPVQRHDGLACARRTGDARRPGVVALHPLPLLGVQEDRPLLPREIEGALQLLDVRHHAEAALGIGMIERIRRRHGGLRHARLATGRQFQQRLRRLGGQMVGQGQQRVLGRLPDIGEPLGGHAVAEQFVIGRLGENAASSRRPASAPRQFRLHIDRDDDLLHRLADLDQLRGARLRMRLQLAPFRPVVGLVVVIDVAEQEARLAPVNDQPDVAADPHRPEVLVLRLVELVEAHAGIGRVELQVEGRRLDGLLLVAGQAGEAVGEGVGDAEFHDITP